MDMSDRLSVPVKGEKLHDIGILAGIYMHYCANVPCLQAFFVYIVC